VRGVAVPRHGLRPVVPLAEPSDFSTTPSSARHSTRAVGHALHSDDLALDICRRAVHSPSTVVGASCSKAPAPTLVPPWCAHGPDPPTTRQRPCRDRAKGLHLAEKRARMQAAGGCRNASQPFGDKGGGRVTRHPLERTRRDGSPDCEALRKTRFGRHSAGLARVRLRRGGRVAELPRRPGASCQEWKQATALPTSGFRFPGRRVVHRDADAPSPTTVANLVAAHPGQGRRCGFPHGRPDQQRSWPTSMGTHLRTCSNGSLSRPLLGDGKSSTAAGGQSCCGRELDGAVDL